MFEIKYISALPIVSLMATGKLISPNLSFGYLLMCNGLGSILIPCQPDHKIIYLLNVVRPCSPYIDIKTIVNMLKARQSIMSSLFWAYDVTVIFLFLQLIFWAHSINSPAKCILFTLITLNTKARSRHS